MKELSYFHNVVSPKVVKNISAWDVFEMIKKSDFSDLIKDTRKGDMDYEFVKTRVVPAFTYNFSYNKYKKDSNIASATGFLYIDIDNKNFDPSVLDMDKICALYKSFGGEGYSIVVRVDGLTLENFESTYFSVCEDLGISLYIDKGAKKPSQYNVLSYDPNIQVNTNPKIYQGILTTTQPKPCTQTIEKKKEKHIYNEGAQNNQDHLCGNLPLRFTNASDNVERGEDYLVDFEGKEEIKCWIPPRKLKEGRNNLLLSYASNLVILNPFIDMCRAKDVLATVNNQAFKNPVHDDQLERVLKTVFEYKEKGTLVPHYATKKRKIMFAADTKMTREEKNGIVIKAIADMRMDASKEKLSNIVLNWDSEKYGKMTQLAIVRNHPISRKTVQKYWKFAKELIEA